MGTFSAAREAHRIVIVGGGAGGLVLATQLGHRLGRSGRARVTLVDHALTHVWKPLLHEVAVGTLDSHKDDVIYLAHAKAHGFHFQPGRMVALDRAHRRIELAPVLDAAGGTAIPARTLPYDTLVIAVGGVSNDFGIPGVKEHCRFLDTVEQAEGVQQAWLQSCLRAQNEPAPRREGALHMAIVGAGATGVELAAELHKAVRQMVSYNLDNIRPDRDVRITLIEAAPRVLPALPQRLAEVTERELKRLGIAVHTGEVVAEVTDTEIVTKSGKRFIADHKMWAAGVKAPDFLRDLDGLETNRSGQLVVDQTLRVTRDDHIFALGDCASCPNPGSERPVPPRAQAAYQQAKTLAATLARRLDGRPAVPFIYRDYGSLVSISYSSIGNLMGNLLGSVMLEGFLARIAYLSLYKKHQQALHGFAWVFLATLINILRRSTEPRLKLH